LATAHQYLEIPYVLIMESVPRADGEWVRRASYPELPDCAVEADSAVEAVAMLDRLRIQRIQELLDGGKPVPVPRPALR
jgi:predicted RNase H-like HicB family nuclease